VVVHVDLEGVPSLLVYAPYTVPERVKVLVEVASTYKIVAALEPPLVHQPALDKCFEHELTYRRVKDKDKKTQEQGPDVIYLVREVYDMVI